MPGERKEAMALCPPSNRRPSQSSMQERTKERSIEEKRIQRLLVIVAKKIEVAQSQKPPSANVA
jgi:hypothetical protein